MQFASISYLLATNLGFRICTIILSDAIEVLLYTKVILRMPLTHVARALLVGMRYVIEPI